MTPLERPRAFIPAILIAAVVMILTGVAAFLLLESAVERSTPALEAATRAGAAAVGNAVAGQIAHALEIGIPLDRLEDVEPYLQGIVSGSPQVKALALVDQLIPKITDPEVLSNAKDFRNKIAQYATK